MTSEYFIYQSNYLNQAVLKSHEVRFLKARKLRNIRKVYFSKSTRQYEPCYILAVKIATFYKFEEFMCFIKNEKYPLGNAHTIVFSDDSVETVATFLKKKIKNRMIIYQSGSFYYERKHPDSLNLYE
ncbi:hypothetical protein NUSPORA_00599 [Nucleospora cyclopteri]